MELNYLTDQALHQDTLSLVNREREILSKLLWHLKEIDRRRLFSDFKCSSLFDYCVKTLKYSEGQAARRVAACRLLREIPQIANQVETGEINLTQLNQAKSFFTDEKISNAEKKLEILQKIKGKTTRETEKALWEMKKESSPKKTWLSLNEGTVAKINTVKGMRAHVHPDMDSFLVKAMNEVETLWTPSVKRSGKAESQTRYLPPTLKALVWQRDHGKCRRCESTQYLEYDHIIPYSMGGKSTPDNIQLLCWGCNQRKSIDNSTLSPRPPFPSPVGRFSS